MQFNFMKYALLIEKARSSFWFLPGAMVLASILLAIFTVCIDAFFITSLDLSIPIIYKMDIEAIRSLLAMIAGAMITVTSIAFSITIVALTLASSQFGPRLLCNFMMDIGTQFVLGAFISNFLFCILVFCAISFQEPYAFKPGLTVIIAVAMTCISVGVLIYFIHHVAKSIQADIVIDDVYCELQNGIEKLFPSCQYTNKVETSLNSIGEGFRARSNQKNILSICSGYVQTVDIEGLLMLAKESDILIECHFKPGDFVVEGSVMAIAHSDTSIDDNAIKKIAALIVLGACRTPVQDPEFAIHQLVEIALRALSPGINDPYSAITCIDKLNTTLCLLTKRTFPEKQHVDQAGILRVICKVPTFKYIAKAAFDQIRQQANNNVSVTIRLLVSLQELMMFAGNDEQKHFVIRQTKMIKEQQSKQSLAEQDLKEINAKVDAILSTVD
ncbi:DUF2254 domain-containing protein [Psychromonas arctica]|uniref:DUF2254 domain-containing protein n=1 Tax=Psychromonas arctica TaxID=168275 RepID=A0ABU9HBY8_9GAMM